MIFWKRELAELNASKRSFEDIYSIMHGCFNEETFSEQFINGRVEKWSYGRLFDTVDSIAASISERLSGHSSGTVTLALDNSPLWVATFFAILKAGHRPLLMNLRLDKTTRHSIIRNSKSLLVIADAAADYESFITPEGLLGGQGEISLPWCNEIALLTSGTTGEPKVILYDGQAISAQLLLSEEIIKTDPTIKEGHLLNVRMLAFLPFYHIFGLMATLFWFFFFGRTYIFLPSLDAQALVFACKYHRVSHLFAVPMLWDLVAANVRSEARRQGKLEKLEKGIELSNKLQNLCPRFGRFVARQLLFKDVRKKALGESLHFCISGGGFMSPETSRLMTGLGYCLHNGYGMTETGVLSVELSQRSRHLTAITAGKPFRGVKYSVAEDGLLSVSGDTLFIGQLIDGKEVRRDKSEPFVTGDLFELHPSGRWRPIGRRDDIIIGSDGENINPDLIEQRLTVPYAEASTIIGMNIAGDDRPVLIIQFSPDTAEFERAYSVSAVREQLELLPLNLRPFKIFCTEAVLPVTLGKVRRAALNKSICDGSLVLNEAVFNSRASLDKLRNEALLATLERVRAVFCRVLSIEPPLVKDDSHFGYDLGGNSLMYYSLYSEISSEFSVSLEMEADHLLFTPREFALAVMDKKGGA